MKIPPLGTHALIDEALTKEMEAEKSGRGYLGYSEVGDPCERKLFFSFHDKEKVFEPRIKRIFEIGHILEDYAVELLRRSGLSVWNVNPETSEQYRVRHPDYPISGGMDGVVKGLPESDRPHLLEIKTANNNRFKQFVKHGVQKTEVKYWSQVHSYMKHFKLDRCLFMVINKNDSDLYFERIPFDPFEAEVADQKAIRVVTAEKAEDLDRIAKKRTDFKCKWCKYKEKCFG